MEFNVIQVPDIIEPATLSATSTTDSLSAYRDPQTGLVGVSLVIRPGNDDPQSAFGSSEYYFQKTLPVQVGLS